MDIQLNRWLLIKSNKKYEKIFNELVKYCIDNDLYENDKYIFNDTMKIQFYYFCIKNNLN